MNTDHKIPAPKVTFKAKGSLMRKPDRKLLKVSLSAAAAALVIVSTIGTIVYVNRTQDDDQLTAQVDSVTITDKTQRNHDTLVVNPNPAIITDENVNMEAVSSEIQKSVGVTSATLERVASVSVSPQNGGKDHKTLAINNIKDAAANQNHQDEISNETNDNSSEIRTEYQRAESEPVIRGKELALATVEVKPEEQIHINTSNPKVVIIYVPAKAYAGSGGLISYLMTPKGLRQNDALEDLKESFKERKAELPHIIASVKESFTKPFQRRNTNQKNN